MTVDKDRVVRTIRRMGEELLAAQRREDGRGLLVRYQTDLLHDAAAVVLNPGPFVWIVREGGTHLMFLSSDDTWDICKLWDKGYYFEDDVKVFFAWDTQQLIACACAKSAFGVAEKYRVQDDTDAEVVEHGKVQD